MFRTWKFHAQKIQILRAQKMEILHSKMEIVRSEGANFALKNCNVALNRLPRILSSKMEILSSENGNSVPKKGNFVLRKWKFSLYHGKLALPWFSMPNHPILCHSAMPRSGWNFTLNSTPTCRSTCSTWKITEWSFQFNILSLAHHHRTEILYKTYSTCITIFDTQPKAVSCQKFYQAGLRLYGILTNLPIHSQPPPLALLATAAA